MSVNYAEFTIVKEIPPMLKLRCRRTNKNVSARTKLMLVIDTGLIGDCIATLPALSVFLAEHKTKADLIVSPAILPLAKRLHGVRSVFSAKSAYNRKIEGSMENAELEKEYDTLVVLRISPQAYAMIRGIRYRKLVSYDKEYFKFFGHLVKNNVLLGKPVKQWRDINFAILGLKPRHVSAEQIFDFTKDERIALPGTNKNKLLIHTGSGWRGKLWPNKNWITLLQKIHDGEKNRLSACDIIFIGATAEEQASYQEISGKFPFKTYSLIGKADLKTLFLIMRSADHFIGVDSGPRNLAHIADLRSVTLLGPGGKDFLPENKNDIWIDKSSPRATGILSFGDDMEKITPDEVHDAFLRLRKQNLAQDLHKLDKQTFPDGKHG
jgi:ADP-heptose:LPS heptosyltransferase